MEGSLLPLTLRWRRQIHRAADPCTLHELGLASDWIRMEGRCPENAIGNSSDRKGFLTEFPSETANPSGNAAVLDGSANEFAAT